jgi:3-oxoacyl-[acyl-carrier protein] reductase
MKGLQGQIALVTGASRTVGIGHAIARTLAAAGADVYITYYRPYDKVSGLAGKPNEPELLLEELRGLGVRAAGAEYDLSDIAAPASIFDVAQAALGPISILINNATYSLNDTIETLTADMLDKHYAVNLRGMALMCKEFVIRYRAAGLADGRIVNLTSGQSQGPMVGELAYVATKGAVEALSVSLSAEIAPLGITVNAVNPGITDTGWIPRDQKAVWERGSPRGRIGQPADAARLIAFLASSEAHWITGEVINSTGGVRG